VCSSSAFPIPESAPDKNKRQLIKRSGYGFLVTQDEATIFDSVEPPKKFVKCFINTLKLQLMCEIVTNFIKVFHRMPETFRRCVFTYECTDKIQPHRERAASGFKRIRVF
jgi:hypothetical protein